MIKKKDVQKLLQEHKSQFIVEQKFINDTLEFIDMNTDFYTRENTIGHITASAWILDKEMEHGLLIHHRKLNKWFQPGGHIEPEDKSIFNASLREAKEETGIDKLIPISQNIFDIDIHVIPGNQKTPKHLHYDIRFAFVTTTNEYTINTNEVKDIKWIEINNALQTPEEFQGIIRMLEKSIKLR